MKEFWDSRYNTDAYSYGIEPNRFFAQELCKLEQGKILLPADGEGRNAVFAAQNGWEVTAFDFSEIAQKKALQLASKNRVKIDYSVSDYRNFQAKENYFDCIALIYAHIIDEERTEQHRKLITFLKPGGKLILEAFSKKQIDNNTGGPQSLRLLYSKEELALDFSLLRELEVTSHQIILKEGQYHKGLSDLIRLEGLK